MKSFPDLLSQAIKSIDQKEISIKLFLVPMRKENRREHFRGM